MTDTVLATIDRAPVTEALTWPDRAAALVIRTTEQYAAAADLLIGIKALRKRIADTFDGHVNRAFQLHRALVAERNSADAPLTSAERLIKDKLVAWDTEQERIRKAEQLRLAELARQQEESRRLAEAAAMEREAAATGDVLLRQEAEALISEPVDVPVVQVESATPKVDGLSYRTTYSATVVDMLALVNFCASNHQHLELLLPNTTALNIMARALKQGLSIPGVRVVVKRDVAAGAR